MNRPGEPALGQEQIDRLAYSPGQAAQALGCSRQFIYNLINSGELRSTTVGRRRFISRAALEELLGGTEA